MIKNIVKGELAVVSHAKNLGEWAMGAVFDDYAAFENDVAKKIFFLPTAILRLLGQASGERCFKKRQELQQQISGSIAEFKLAIKRAYLGKPLKKGLELVAALQKSLTIWTRQNRESEEGGEGKVSIDSG